MYLIFLETRIIDLHFAADTMGVPVGLVLTEALFYPKFFTRL